MSTMSVAVPPSMMKQLLRLLAWRIPIDGSKTRDASEREGTSTIPAITTCNLLGLHGRVLEQRNERSVLATERPPLTPKKVPAAIGADAYIQSVTKEVFVAIGPSSERLTRSKTRMRLSGRTLST